MRTSSISRALQLPHSLRPVIPPTSIRAISLWRHIITAPSSARLWVRITAWPHPQVGFLYLELLYADYLLFFFFFPLQLQSSPPLPRGATGAVRPQISISRTRWAMWRLRMWRRTWAPIHTTHDHHNMRAMPAPAAAAQLALALASPAALALWAALAAPQAEAEQEEAEEVPPSA